MKKINLMPYTKEVPNDMAVRTERVLGVKNFEEFQILQEEIRNEISKATKPFEFNVARNLAGILFHAKLKLDKMELRSRDKIADKIEAAEPSGYVILEDAEYQKVLKSSDSYEGASRIFVEFFDRIDNAENYDPNKNKE